MILRRTQQPRVLQAACTVDMEKSASSLHAYADLVDVNVGPGDEVLLLGVDPSLQFGERRQLTAAAVIRRAGWLRRTLCRFTELFELTSLYDISFSDRRTL